MTECTLNLLAFLLYCYYHCHNSKLYLRFSGLACWAALTLSRRFYTWFKSSSRTVSCLSSWPTTFGFVLPSSLALDLDISFLAGGALLWSTSTSIAIRPEGFVTFTQSFRFIQKMLWFGDKIEKICVIVFDLLNYFLRELKWLLLTFFMFLHREKHQ